MAVYAGSALFNNIGVVMREFYGVCEGDPDGEMLDECFSTRSSQSTSTTATRKMTTLPQMRSVVVTLTAASLTW